MTNESKIKDVIRRILGQAETEDKMVDMLYQLLTPKTDSREETVALLKEAVEGWGLNFMSLRGEREVVSLDGDSWDKEQSRIDFMREYLQSKEIK